MVFSAMLLISLCKSSMLFEASIVCFQDKKKNKTKSIETFLNFQYGKNPSSCYFCSPPLLKIVTIQKHWQELITPLVHYFCSGTGKSVSPRNIHLTSRCGEDEGKQDTTAACFLLTASDLKPGKHSSPCTVVPQKLQCFSFTITHQYPKWRKELVKRWKQVQIYHDDLCSAAPCSRLWGYAINVFCN